MKALRTDLVMLLPSRPGRPPPWPLASARPPAVALAPLSGSKCAANICAVPFGGSRPRGTAADHFRRVDSTRARFAANLRTVCHNVAAEPHLQPLNGETMAFRSAITDDGARLDIRARGFWNAAQDAFFDVRVFYPNAPSNRSSSITAAYRKHENDKKRAYGQRVREVEHGVFTPLVLSSTGGMGREATTFFKRLADMLSHKQQKPYSVVMNWLRCRLSFAALRSSIMCIRGSRSSIHHPIHDADITLATYEGRIPQHH